MRKICSLLLMLLLPCAALAQTTALPDLFAVVGVQSTDKLNIRAEPDAKAPVLAQLAPDATGIEVLRYAAGGAWALVNSGEQSGWVATRFLRQEPDVWRSASLPKGLSCYGTEPFWDLRFDNNQLRLKAPDMAEVTSPIRKIQDRRFAEDRLRVVRSERMDVVITPQDCSDGMSDRSFALQAVLLMRDAQAPLYTGCCSIAP